MKVRRAVLSDVEELAQLFNDYRTFYHQPSDIEGARLFLKERLSRDESVVFVVVDEKEMVGFTQLYPSFSSVSLQPMWILNDLFVAPQARKQGVGQMLLDGAKEHAIQSGAKSLILETDWDNVFAQKLYEKNDYERDTKVFHYTLPLQ
ncbi:GNAT family N-acetyltransferase [Rossellomorea aquimaris]|uniref:GNAT family N-acetyltransferase n=1 Tax=Rossellomorea aquimaris TaxID=189382 RepID=UPI0007D086CC|nr:GNAT family N-acetyltransferase [Rossellomorea aquimaris]